MDLTFIKINTQYMRYKNLFKYGYKYNGIIKKKTLLFLEFGIFIANLFYNY